MSRDLIALALAGLATTSHAQLEITDDFESYAPGTFPSPDWIDAASVIDPPLVPLPSAVVEETTGPDGSPTRALASVENIGASQGAYQVVPVSKRYICSADIRVDRFADVVDGNVGGTWAWAFGPAKLVDQADFGGVPQAVIYADQFSQGWHLYLIGTNGSSGFPDLGVPVDLGRWYRVVLDLDAELGVVSTRITDPATGECLVDRVDVIEGWTPADGQFDLISIFESDIAAQSESNLCVIDNVSVQLFGDPSCPADLTGSSDPNDPGYGVPDGTVDALDFFFYLDLFVAGCP